MLVDIAKQTTRLAFRHGIAPCIAGRALMVSHSKEVVHQQGGLWVDCVAVWVVVVLCVREVLLVIGAGRVV